MDTTFQKLHAELYVHLLEQHLCWALTCPAAIIYCKAWRIVQARPIKKIIAMLSRNQSSARVTDNIWNTIYKNLILKDRCSFFVVNLREALAISRYNSRQDARVVNYHLKSRCFWLSYKITQCFKSLLKYHVHFPCFVYRSFQYWHPKYFYTIYQFYLYWHTRKQLQYISLYLTTTSGHRVMSSSPVVQEGAFSDNIR